MEQTSPEHEITKNEESKSQDKIVQERSAKLEEFVQSKPVQIDLFNFLDLKPASRPRYSNTIELYDFMPKYYWGKVERIAGRFLESLEREFECRGVKYKIQISPASIVDPDGVERYYYPSKREELVEDALRRLATTEKGLFLDDKAAVTFTLYQLQQELKANGHSYSITQIKDALLICKKTNITVSTEDGKAIFVSNLFETLGLNTREDWQEKGTDAKAFVRFNSLVTESIKRGSYRQLDYKKSMEYKSVISRQLHKRISHHYTQADITKPYHIKLSTIIRDFGVTEYDQLRDNFRQVEFALKEMEEKEVLLYFKCERIVDEMNRNKLLDVKFMLTPHPKFRSEVINANSRQRDISLQLPINYKTTM